MTPSSLSSLHRWHLFWMASLPISLKSLLSLTADTHMNMKEGTSRFEFLRCFLLGVLDGGIWHLLPDSDNLKQANEHELNECSHQFHFTPSYCPVSGHFQVASLMSKLLSGPQCLLSSQGAVNLHMEEEVEEFLLKKPIVPADGKRVIVVFHCEFSSERGPRMWVPQRTRLWAEAPWQWSHCSASVYTLCVFIT